MRGLKRAAMTGVAASMAVAAVAVVTVKVSAMSWSGQPAMIATMHAGLSASSGHRQPAPVQVATAAPSLSPASSQPSIAPAPRPAAAPSALRQTRQLAASAPVLLYTAAPSAPIQAPESHRDPAMGSDNVQSAANAVAPSEDRDVPPVLVTLLSEAAFVLKPSEQRPIVLPISFGQPPAPETDAAPADRRWHHHGLLNARHSYFLPAPPIDAVSAICRTPSMLH